MSNKAFGTEPLPKLLRAQSIPAAIGILVMSIYGIVDTIFVGHWVGPLGIGAVTVVTPITFLMSSIGMAIGIGGASIISRAFGKNDNAKAHLTFGNQVMLTITFAVLFLTGGYFFQNEILTLFGGKGELLEPSREYFTIVLAGVPFLTWAMMSNNVIRAEGYPRLAMYTLLVPAVINMVLDPILISVFDMGLKGAAWSTTISYAASMVYTLTFFLGKKSQMKLNPRCFKLDVPIIREMSAIGSVTLARQGTVGALSMVLNNTLFAYGSEMAISAYGIVSRLMMFANAPVLGITQGSVPILGFNYGAELYERVRSLVQLSIKTASIIAVCIFLCIMIFAELLVSIFTSDAELIAQTVPALRSIFLATPLIAFNLIGSAYFQSIGKALPALMLTLSKQGFFLIPLVLILPHYFGLEGVWYAFPIADVGAALITWIYLRKGLNNMR